MINQNNSKKIRKYVCEQCELINLIYSPISEIEISEILFQSIDNYESNQTTHMLIGCSLPHEFNFNALKGTALLMRIQLYTDYYKSVKCQDKLYGTNVLMKFPKIKSYEDLQKFSKDENTQYEMLDSLKEYNESSGFDKVLFAKCLDKKDINHLKAINPFFEEEYEKCNVNVDLDFMFRHIKKWQNFFPMDVEMSYDQASRFIFDLYKLNKEEAENLLIDLFNEDLGIFNSTGQDEEYIQMGDLRINLSNLAIMLKNYYKYKEKILNKRR